MESLTISNVHTHRPASDDFIFECVLPDKFQIKAAHISQKFMVSMCIELNRSKPGPWLAVGQQIVVRGRQSPLASTYHEMWRMRNNAHHPQLSRIQSING